MSDPHDPSSAQPVELLAQMLAGLEKMCQDQAVVQQEHLMKLQEHSDQQTKVLEQLVRGAAPPKSLPLSVAMHRMGDGDDPQVFLEAFCATAEVCQCPQAEWAPWLISLLSGEAQTAALKQLPTSRGTFTDVSQAVLDRMSLASEDHRWRFCACKLTGRISRLHGLASSMTWWWGGCCRGSQQEKPSWRTKSCSSSLWRGLEEVRLLFCVCKSKCARTCG